MPVFQQEPTGPPGDRERVHADTGPAPARTHARTGPLKMHGAPLHIPVVTDSEEAIS